MPVSAITRLRSLCKTGINAEPPEPVINDGAESRKSPPIITDIRTNSSAGKRFYKHCGFPLIFGSIPAFCRLRTTIKPDLIPAVPDNSSMEHEKLNTCKTIAHGNFFIRQKKKSSDNGEIIFTGAGHALIIQFGNTDKAYSGNSAVSHYFCAGYRGYLMKIVFSDITLGYYRHPVVHHLNLEIGAGTATAIVGPNGGGKSTLLKGIMGFIKPLSGKIILEDLTLRDIGYLPQSSAVDKTFPLTAAELIATGLWKSSGWFRRITSADREKIQNAIRKVRLSGMENEPLKALSGGQIQRALFARLILQDARVIILDEPFNAIDFKTINDLWQLIEDWKAEGRTVIAVLHNYQMVREHFSDVIMISRELIARGTPAEVLTEENITRAFGMEIFPHHNAGICRRTPEKHDHHHTEHKNVEHHH